MEELDFVCVFLDDISPFNREGSWLWLTNWTSRHPSSVTGVKLWWLRVFIVYERCVTARDVSEASFMPTQDPKCDGPWRSPAPWPGQTQMEKTGRHGWLYAPRGLEERRLCAVFLSELGRMSYAWLLTHSSRKSDRSNTLVLYETEWLASWTETWCGPDYSRYMEGWN